MRLATLISAFDEKKKFAIIRRLFDNKKLSFRDKTVLMLTHDFQPIIDYVHGSFFSRYVFRKRDLAALIVLLMLASAVVAVKLSGSLSFVFYPEMSGELLNKRALWAYACYTVLTMLPVIGEVAEREKWKSLRSKI